MIGNRTEFYMSISHAEMRERKEGERRVSSLCWDGTLNLHHRLGT